MPIELRSDNLRLADFIKPGDSILVGQGTGEPLCLTRALIEQRHAIGPLNVFLGASFAETWDSSHADVLAFCSYGGIGVAGKLAKAGVLDILPQHLSELPRLIAGGTLKVDVVFVQLARNAAGALSFACGYDYLADAMRRARVVVAEINEQAPWTHGGEALKDLRIDYAVHTSRPPVELPSRPIGDIEARIAEHAARYIGDGAVLETGIGAIPDAILSRLGDRRHLGIHSGMISDGVVELIESGVIDNATKTIDRGITVAGVLFGSRRLFGFADNNAALRLQPVDYTHGGKTLGKIARFVAINGALEVDLSGQVNAEVAGNHYLGAVGGQGDFVRAALQSPGGRSIIALRSTVAGDTLSCIVGSCRRGVATTPRSDADIVVTEWGAAELRGKTLRQRARALIAVAHPKFRETLERQVSAVSR